MAEKNTQSVQPFLEYKGRPLVRCGKTLYYGNLYDDYVVMMQVVDTVPFKDQDCRQNHCSAFKHRSQRSSYRAGYKENRHTGAL